MFKKNTFKLFAALSVLLLALAVILTLLPTQVQAQAAPTPTRTNTVCSIIGGYVRVGSSSGPGLANVKVTGVSTTGATIGTATTDSNGYFTLDAKCNSAVVVTPVLSGYTFSPTQQSYHGVVLYFVATATGGITNTPTRTRTPGTSTPTVTPTSLTGLYPDLVISSVVSSPPGWTGGCALTQTSGIRVTVMNSGTVDAGSFVVDVSGTQQTVAGLAAGATLNLWFSRTGSLTITVDITNMVVESNEGNNTRSYVTITGTPPVLCTRTPTPTGPAPATNTPTLTPTRTNIPCCGLTATRTPTTGPTATRTLTPTVVTGVCSPVTSTITAPFTYDGAGVFCWQSTNLGSYVNTWNVVSLKINGVEFANQYVPYSSWPPKINGFWYVSYNATAAYAHVEFK